MSFRFEDYTDKYVMCCETKQESDEFCKVMDEAKKTWSTGIRYTERNRWNQYKENTCYDFNNGMYCEINYFIKNKDEGWKILFWKDFRNENMCRTCRSENCEKCCFNKFLNTRRED